MNIDETKGILFDEIYHLIYLYDPSQPPGKRLSVHLRADSKGTPVCMDEFMSASPLSAYFKFEKKVVDEKTSFPGEPGFAYRATLAKQDGMVSSSFPDRNTGFYTVSPWKPNEKARLMGLFRMMQRLQRPVAYVVSMRPVELSESMRESFRTQIQFIRNAEKMNLGNRDENAEQCLKVYDKFLESLRNNPHFICRVSTYANNEALAKMILDAAASEAVEEGNYRIVCERGQYLPFNPELNMNEVCIADAPRGMRRWNSVFFLKELAPFAMFPTLYPGETIEIPKESAPIHEKSENALYLGKDSSGYDVYMPLEFLSKHALLAGVPGSGKTNSMLHISSELAGTETNIPILVLEPAKKEYRALARNKTIPNLIVFSPGAQGSFPLRINPFEFPLGVKLSEHITNLIKVFEGAFDLEPPMPFLISSGIEQVYRDCGWYPFEVNDGTHDYPTVRNLYDKVAELLDASDYAPDIKSNLKSCLQVRIGSLITREMGNVFDVSASTLSPEEWMKHACVIELESLGEDAANFMTLLLLTIIRELLRQNPEAPEDRPRHVIFLEEAHNLIGPSTVSNAENGNSKVASTKYIVDMLAEVRALGEAIIIADQLPTSLAPQVTKNTSLKIGHRITAMDDRELLASTMSADGVQLEKMGSFQRGFALCTYEKVQKPFEMKIEKYRGDSKSPDNEQLFTLLADRELYKTAMKRDCEIVYRKFAIKKERISEQYQARIRDKETLLDNRLYLQNNEVDQKAKERVEKSEKTHLSNIDKLIIDWLEYIMEIGDYCRINRLQKDSGIRMWRAECVELLEAFEELAEGDKDFYEELVERIGRRIRVVMGWLDNCS